MNQRENIDQYKYWSLYLSKLKRKKRRKTNCPICQKMVFKFLYYKHVDKCSKATELQAKMYNEDVVNTDKETECIICLDNMNCGQRIARLECLCVYHKSCIDLWLEKNVWCPSHPPL